MVSMEGYEIIKADRLCVVWKRRSDGKIVIQGKRVPKDFVLTHEEVRAYVKEGIVACIKLIRARPCQMSLKEAYDLVLKARGDVYIRRA